MLDDPFPFPHNFRYWPTMKILLAATPLPGHVDAMLGIARMLASSVHETCFVTASAYRQPVEAAGARFLPFQGRADMDLRHVNGISAARLQAVGMEIPQRCPELALFDAIPDQYATLQAALAHFEADIIIADSNCFGTLPMLLDRGRARPRVIHCGVSCLQYRRDENQPLHAGNSSLPVPGAGGLHPAFHTAFHSAFHPAFDPGFNPSCTAHGETPPMTPMQQYLNARLAEAGAGPLRMDALTAAVTLPDIYVQPSVPEFEYGGRGLPPSVRFLGTPNPAAGGALPDWAYELDGSRQVVLVTQGEAADGDPDQLIVPTLEAMAEEADVLVLAATGDGSRHALPGAIPPNARIASFVPFGWLMSRVDVLVTPGGYGTVNLALKHGVPSVVAALTEAGSDVAARVAWSGTGIHLRCGEGSAGALKDAIRAVLDEQSYRAAARGMAMAFARIDTRLSLLRLIRETVHHRPPGLA
jgi:UDP:flavonoid glycosyltransferase YjiC (YdhE family)